jgi:glucose/arabinose dehydrogenase
VPEDIALLEGYRIEVVATGLRFPTGVAFDDRGGIYVTEAGYAYGEVFSTPRLVRIDEKGVVTAIAKGEDEGEEANKKAGRPTTNGPWTGVAYANGKFYVAEGGQTRGGRILEISPDGATRAIASSLPSLGDHHTNGPAIGPDGKIYFGQGTATNSAIVGEDNFNFGWLRRHPDFHDVPCRDVTLTGQSFETKNPLTTDEGDLAKTGAFVPFGTPTTPGQVVRGSIPCSGAIMRVAAEGGPIELVAWGFRNPFGLAFAPDGRLLVTDNGYDNRGSRKVHGSADVLWEVKEGAWHGWPDWSEGRPLGDFHEPPGEAKPTPLIGDPPGKPPKPMAYFGVHSSSDGLDISRSKSFGFEGDAFVAQFGDQAPVTNKVFGPVGFKVVRVDLERHVVSDFAVNHGKNNGPASKLGTGGFERPVAVKFDPSGENLYAVDFGVLAMRGDRAEPEEGTGVLWRISREVQR